MSQQLLHELRVHTLREKDRGAGMSQVVEVDIRQPHLLEGRLEAAPTYVGGFERGADLRSEHESPTLIQRSSL